MATPEDTALADLARIATALEGINRALLAMLDQVRKPEPETDAPKVLKGLFGGHSK